MHLVLETRVLTGGEQRGGAGDGVAHRLTKPISDLKKSPRARKGRPASCRRDGRCRSRTRL